jgi:pimeloyl-ACP methyl ester carboxylesterase
MVLDANVAPQDYQAGHYGVYALDTDKAFAGFVETCFDAEDDCALYTYVKPSAVQDLLDAVNLAIRPLARNAPASMQAYNAYLAIKGPLLEPLYSPRQWAGFAITLVAWLNGTIPLPMDTSSAASLPTYGTAEGAVMGIRASDATFIANSSDQYLTQLEFQTQVSPGFSDIAYFALWVSAQWKMPAKERYWGDFKATTKTPILYVNGIADPVTPLANAYNASAGFKDSVVLPHNGYGHGVFVDPSECVAKHVRAYFKDATLPQGNITCEPDSSLLETWKATLQATEAATSSGGDDRSAAGNGTATPPAQGGASHNGLSGWLTVMILLGATTSYLL